MNVVMCAKNYHKGTDCGLEWHSLFDKALLSNWSFSSGAVQQLSGLVDEVAS